jgi:hypothetical protein
VHKMFPSCCVQRLTYLNLEMLDKAAEELKIAERLESSSPVVPFLRFKLALLRNSDQDGRICSDYVHFQPCYVFNSHINEMQ